MRPTPEQSPALTSSEITHGRVVGRRGLEPFIVSEVHHSAIEVGAHAHERGNFSILLTGCYTETVDRRRFECVPGTIIFKPAGCEHANLFPSATTSLIVEWDASHPSFAHFSPDARPIVEPRQSLVTRGRLPIDELRRAARADDHGTRLTALGVILQIMALDYSKEPAGGRTGGVPDAVRRAIIYINDCYREKLTLPEVAQAVGTSASSLSRQFHDTVGCTVGAYVRRVRVDRAVDLLTNSDDSLSSISYATGFYDQSHMTHAFKRQLGATPGQLRHARRP